MDEPAKHALLEECYSSILELNRKFPGEWTIESVIEQLKFLKEADFESKQIEKKRNDLNFGFLGMRFINELDGQLARKLSELNSLI